MAAKRKARKKTGKKVDAGVGTAIRICFFPRALRAIKSKHVAWRLRDLQDRVDTYMARSSRRGDPYYCEDQPVEGKPNCYQQVCYDELGNEIWRGRERCPPR